MAAGNSNREALRRLSRKIPSAPDIEAIHSKLDQASDTHSAVVAASLTEAELEQLLVKKFHFRNPNLIGQLFNNKGPLSDFHSKILVAEAFGVIVPGFAHDLHIIKIIRNTFAHAKVDVGFELELISIELRNSILLGAVADGAALNNLSRDVDNRKSYLLLNRMMAAFLRYFAQVEISANAALHDIHNKDKHLVEALREKSIRKATVDAKGPDRSPKAK